MELKNKEIKKLFDYVAPYFDLFSLPSAMTEFMACDEAIEGEIAGIKAELTDANLRKDIYHSSVDHLRNMALEKGDELRKANNKISDLEEQLANAKQRLTLLENSRTGWRSRAQHAEKGVTDLNKKINELEEENANLRVTPFDTLEALKKENSDLENELTKAKRLEEIYHRSGVDLYEENDRLRGVVDILEKEINTLKKKIHELEEENIHKRPWHGDANAMTGGRTCCESLTAAIEFQNKKIEELEAEKTRLKEAYDIQETTINRLKLLLGKEHKKNEALARALSRS